MGPIPLNCDSPLVDEIIDELTSFGSKYKERVIYLGKLCFIQDVGLRAASKCINNYRGNTSLNMKALFAQTILIWMPFFENFTLTSNQRIRGFSKEWIRQLK